MQDQNILLDRLKIRRVAAAPRWRPNKVKLLVIIAVAGCAWAGYTLTNDLRPGGQVEHGAPELSQTEDRKANAPTQTASVAPAVQTHHAPAAADQPGAVVSPEVVLESSGYVTARRVATVSSRITGRVESLLFEEGDVVAKGALLAELDSEVDELELALVEARFEATKAALSELKVEARHATIEADRFQSMNIREHVSASQIDTAVATADVQRARVERQRRLVEVARREVMIQRAKLRDSQIRAPFHGIIVAKTAQPGEIVSPISAGGSFTRSGIGTIVDMASLEVEVDVSESDINRVKPGQSVLVTMNSYPDLELDGRVIAIVPTADRNKATIKVRVGFESTDQRVIPDLGVRVSFLNASDGTEGPKDERHANS